MNESDKFLSLNTANNTRGISKPTNQDLPKSDSLANANQLSTSLYKPFDPLTASRSILTDTKDSNLISLFTKFLTEIDQNNIVAYDPPNAYDSYQQLMKLREEHKALKEKATIVFSNK
ncbi:MAG: hypothetical protein ACKN86_02670, partial [Crocinitomicaceae bacterium]